MNKKLKTAIITICSIVVLAGTFFGGFWAGRSLLDEDVRTLNYIITMYKKYYYEQTDDIIGVIEDALLDRYSEYYTKEEYDLVKLSSQGVREGIGISYNADTNIITLVVGNSPAKKAGVKEGAIVLAVGETAENLKYVSKTAPLADLLDNIPAETPFILRVDYNGETIDYNLSKTRYTQTFVSYFDSSGEYGFSDQSGEITFERLGDNVDYKTDNESVGIIKYTSFSGLSGGISGSATQFSMALQKFKESGKTKLILDLRNNGGGYMSILESICAHLIDAPSGTNQLVSYAQYNDGTTSDFYSDRVVYSDYGFEKIVILANSNSASASEALLGAVLDYDKNKIVNVILEKTISDGETVYKTYGKGIMQSTYSRLTGEAIKLTTAKIYWPVSKVSIHNVGLTPSLDDRILPESESGCVYDGLSLCR